MTHREIAVSFATEFQAHLEADPKLSRRGARLLALLRARPSQRKARRIAAMEAHARGAMGIGPTEKVDWAAIDWPTVIGLIVKVLLALLPFLLAL